MMEYYDKRSIGARNIFTNCVVDGLQARAHLSRVLPTDEFLAEIRRRAGVDADVGRALGIPSSRVAELFSGKRRLRYEEAKVLADTFMPEDATAPISAEKLAPILASCLKLAPSGGWKESDAQLLAQSVEYGLQLLTTGPATQSSADALAVAGHAASLRLRDLRSAT